MAHAVQLELERDLHLAGALADEVIAGARAAARLAPERPDHGVEERALAVAIRTREACDADAFERQGRVVLAIREEVA